jgi:hypothetical protein
MRFSAVFALGLAAFVMASPVPEAEASVAEISEKRGLAESLVAALPHPISGADKIMSAAEPSDLVTRQANTTATANAAAKKGASF